jgi:UrcA family protein
MTVRNYRFAALVAAGAAAALGLTLAAGSAAAQSATYGPPYYEPAYYGPDYGSPPPYTTGELVVIAPRTVGRSAIGAPVQAVREQRVVYADDLDLSTPWGPDTMRARIERAARDACDDLDARYPITVDDGRDCVSAAVRGAMRQAEYVVGFTPPNWPYGG